MLIDFCIYLCVDISLSFLDELDCVIFVPLEDLPIDILDIKQVISSFQ